jgi:hypothetical protein
MNFFPKTTGPQQNQTVYSKICNVSETASQMVAGTWLLLHILLCPVALSVREYLETYSIPVVPHLPYSQPLAVCDLLLLLKLMIRGKDFKAHHIYNQINMAAAGHSTTGLPHMQ